MKLLLYTLLIPFAAKAATYTANTGSWTDVSNALYSCSVGGGDTVAIPSGGNTWAGTLVVSKPVVFSGAGATGGSRTRLSESSATLFNITTAGPVKFENLSLDKTALKTTDAHSIYVTNPLTNGYGLWISHCEFNFGSRMIYAVSRCYGLIEQCSFNDADIAVAIQNEQSADDGAYEWSLGLRAGTTNCMVVENNLFIWTAASDGQSLDEIIYGQNADRDTFRHNVCISSNSTVTVSMFNPHGYYATWGRGTMLYEIYENYFGLNNHCGYLVAARGGTIFFFSNVVDSATANQTFFRTRNEVYQNSGGTIAFNSTDQLANCHVWSNILNGVTQDGLNHGEPAFFNADPDSNGVVYDKASWSALYTPGAWGGGAGYVTSVPFVVPTYVTDGGKLYRCTSNHTSSASDEPGVGVNWATYWTEDQWHFITRAPQNGDTLYPYTPLTYPHPLVPIYRVLNAATTTATTLRN